MNIVGENFPEPIVDQIRTRQEKKGSLNRNPGGNPSLLVWQNANTGWVKMVSSVDVDDERFKSSNSEMAASMLVGSKLAKQYVLFGGVYDQGLGKNGLRGGIARDKSILNNSAYGLGGLDYGLVPMPGITSFNIKTETRGSLKTATVGIKAYNRHQFDIINTLYLSLGFSMLIEWGNTMYYDNGSENLITDNPYSLADEFIEGKYKWDKILPEINKYRLASCGNYDAALGKVVNFTWKVNRDLSYDITVTVRSIGDVIESLKMNALSGFVPVIPSVQELVSSAATSGQVTSGLDVAQKAILIRQYYNYLRSSIGLSDIQAKGVLANIGRESTFSYGIKQSGGGAGIGLFQYTAETRKQPFINAVPDWQTNWQGQLDYAFTKDPAGIAFKKRNFTSAEEASLNFLQTFEIPWSNKEEQAQVQPIRQGTNLGYLKIVNIALGSPQQQQPSYNDLVASGQLYGITPTTQPTPSVPLGTDVALGTNTVTEAQIIQSYAYTHDIGALFNNIMIDLQASPPTSGGVSSKKIGDDTVAVKIAFKNNGTLDDRYYIRFGYFLQLLEKNIIYTLKGTTQKIIGFDYNINSNIISLYNRQLSADPSICIFQRTYDTTDPSIKTTLFPELNKFILEGSGTTYKSFYGKLMNVYFDMTYILNHLQVSKDNNGIVTLIDLLKSLANGFCSATGNYNSISPTVDENTNNIVFIDNTPLPDREALLLKTYSSGSISNPNKEADFKMFGYFPEVGANKALAGIVRDLSLTTTISPNLASMITIGAQANGYVTGQDSTALSTINRGLKDRVKNEFIEPINPNDGGYSNPLTVPLLLQPQQQPLNGIGLINLGTGQSNPPANPSSPVPTVENKYKDTIATFNKFIQDMVTNTWNQKDISAFSNSISSFAEYDQAERTLNYRKNINPNASSPNIGFLPFDLTLVIDGLSGMKVYQKYTADTEFLPSNYPKSLEFLIKGVTHEIRDNQWITTLESLAIPKNPFGETDAFNVGEPSTGKPSSRAQGASTSVRGNNFSTGRGGATRVIEGKTYKNGQMEGALRPINNQAKYKGAITSDTGQIRLYTKASLALDQLIQAAEQAGIPIKINAGYRTYEDQVRVKAQYGDDAATPGTSNHGFGLAVDFAAGLRRIKPGDKLYDWLAAGNGAKYGFKNIRSESWHWEYQNV
jgi:hypothetical protein